VPGHPVRTILNFARDRGFDLLIIGFGRHSTPYNRLIGGTTDWLVELAPCAVLVVK
jgi:nucleotide-binding universal stress UspA family protein